MGTILVVEDHTDVRELTIDFLEMHGFKVLGAADGQEALDILESLPEPPCVVLLDMMMPVMSGNDFLEVLQARGRLEGLPVIVMTAASHLEAPLARRMLKKPVLLEHVLEVVREYCPS